jgi:hypothetical protein
MITIKNWCLVLYSRVDAYTPPEMIRAKIQGNVYNHPKEKFKDGDYIITSELSELDIENRKAKTKTGNWYILVDPDKEWIDWLKKNSFNESLRELFPN